MSKDAFVGNASDAEQVKEASSKVLRKDKRDLDDLLFMLNNIQCRRFLWKYLSLCGVFRQSFADDDRHTNFYEGKRSIGLQLIAEITKASPDAYLLMMRESKEEKYV